ncbi:multicopper oxidase family protein [Spirillospora sp. CA-294931]|uniref:multicopper oxidase family protein n=1 Tax=Spirillospora sp. CA-294931 TaxID=3240042 RepID=UPI003D8E0295
MTQSRRQFLILAGGAGAVGSLGLYSCGGAEQLGGGDEGDTGGGGDGDPDGTGGRVVKSKARLPKPFQVPLPIPPVLTPDRTEGGVDHFVITQKKARVELIPGHSTEILGYNGIFPGPTIESRSGRRIVVTHRNELPCPTSTHLHGGVTPSGSDGYPLDLLLPQNGRGAVATHHSGSGHRAMAPRSTARGTKDHTYPLEQRAATLWYHDHRMDFTGPQVYLGLAGFHLVRDDEEDALPLPKGAKDVPLMIVDRSFSEGGALMYPARDPSLTKEPGVKEDYMDGVLGDTILVNGAAWPFLEVAATRYRLRLLNASNARVYRLQLDPQPPGGGGFVQVGSDCGLLAAPVTLPALEMAPAERFDVVVDFSRYPVGSRVTLVNKFGSGGTSRIMQFRVVRKERDDSTVPRRLSTVEALDPDKAVTRRKFEFKRGRFHGTRGWTINGKPFDRDTVLARPKLGTTEIWEFRSSATTHPVHLHLGHFQILSRRKKKPGPYDGGWKDTINLRQGERAEVLVKFTGTPGRYVLHCHNLEHEDMAMMANYELT